MQRRNSCELHRGLRRGDENGRVALLVFAGSDQRDGAFVLRCRRIGVNAFVQLRRDGKDKRQKERCEQTTRDQAAEVLIVLSHRLATLRPKNLFARFCFFTPNK